MRLTRARLATALAMTLAVAGIGHAAPGDYRLVNGTLVWPHLLMTERQAVILADDGTTWFAELDAPGGLPRAKAGDRVAVVGRETIRDRELSSASVSPASMTWGASGVVVPSQTGAGDDAAASPALTMPSPPQPMALRPLEMEGTAQAILGTVETISGSMLTVATSDRRVSIDVSRIDADLRATLVPGQGVRVLAEPANDRLIASGLVVDH